MHAQERTLSLLTVGALALAVAVALIALIHGVAAGPWAS